MWIFTLILSIQHIHDLSLCWWIRHCLSWNINRSWKTFDPKCVFLLVPFFKCLTFTVQTAEWAVWQKNLFLYSSPEGGRLLCSFLKNELILFTYRHDMSYPNIVETCNGPLCKYMQIIQVLLPEAEETYQNLEWLCVFVALVASFRMKWYCLWWVARNNIWTYLNIFELLMRNNK